MMGHDAEVVLALGISHLEPYSLGLGATVVGGDTCFRFSPHYPRHAARRAVLPRGHTAPAAGLSVTEVRARFGQPAAQYLVGQDVIMLYDYNLLTRVTATAFPGPG